MKTMTKVFAAALALGGAATSTGTASAHDWRGNGWGYSQQYGGGDRGNFGGACSGQRGYQLERELRFKTSRGLIDYRTAQRIQRDIDKLQWKEQHECREGDWRAVGKIQRDYARIDHWIDEAADQYRGGYWRR
ncbi:hypothetical protein NSE01_09360 [Novosphingobium sediminis]|uniref:Uncharacterized protein n=1 Tax=Novosphingobium sediminis TaxID=707214 RepID=A0A512AHD6_9SPHN|nr:hypothetical protein [Novosphingobium sediminis]GEN99103.1 hypothetical protein NSE01_09360 [Novosphingobium sediminis]